MYAIGPNRENQLRLEVFKKMQLMIVDVHYIMQTITETLQSIREIADTKRHSRIPKLVAKGFMAGALLGFGNLVSIIASASATGTGFEKLISGLTFPIGLVMIIINEMDLFTGNVLYMTVSFQAA